VAPPLRKGRALAAQRLLGLVAIVVLTGLICLSVGLYTKAFTPVVTVTLQVDRIGNQLTKGADVKARGVLVGEVREVRSAPAGPELELALQPAHAARLPSDVRAELLPKTLFGEKFVSLVPAAGSHAEPLREGDVIPRERATTGRETAEALDSLQPLLETLQPEQLSRTLHAVSSALRGRGDRIGGTLQRTRHYLRELNPELPVLAEDFRGTADLADTLTASADDVVAELEDLSAVNASLVQARDDLARFLRDSAGLADTAEDFLTGNEQRVVALARESRPGLDTYARYAPQLPCLLRAIGRQIPLGEAFGGLQPGLHITLEITANDDGYRPGDEPEYGEDSGPTCFGLEGEPVRPFPLYKEVRDGYCDDQEQQPGVQTECARERRAPSASAAATTGSPASWDRAAVGAAVAPALGLTPGEVPDVAVLLYAPVARSVRAG
jgi:phospholipid/cholesterol/gamma-HCH transport system substrate-binding protein